MSVTAISFLLIILLITTVAFMAYTAGKCVGKRSTMYKSAHVIPSARIALLASKTPSMQGKVRSTVSNGKSTTAEIKSKTTEEARTVGA